MKLQSILLCSFFFSIYFLVGYTVAQSPAIPPSPFTPEEEKSHSAFSWDYGELNEASGWWGYWYPICTDDDQSPIDIVSASAASGSDTLVIETEGGYPFSYVGAIIAFKSAFNQLHLDLTANAIKMNIGYASAMSAGQQQIYSFIKANLYFPSVHKLDGTAYDGEIIYSFEGSDHDPHDNAVGTTLTNKNIIMLSFFLKKVTDGTESGAMKNFLTKMYKGVDAGSTQLTPYIPPAKEVYQYPGTEVHPPCHKNYQYFVSGDPILVDSITLQKFIDAVDSPATSTTLTYRAIQPLGTRTVTTFSLNVSTLIPTFDDNDSVVPYRLSPSSLKYSGLIEKYLKDMLIAIVAILLATLLYLLAQRYTHRLPYNLSWVNPVSRTEVFGVPLRYGYETGRPKPDYIPSSTSEVIEEECSMSETESSKLKHQDSNPLLEEKKL